MSQESGRKLGWGVLGGARINRRLIPGVRAAHNAELLAVASREQAKAEAVATQYAVPKAYGSYEALLADPKIEVVYIPLPNTLHIEWAIKAAQAGKHVLVEKPLALTPEDIDPLQEAAAQAGVLVMEAFMYRFHPQHAQVKALIAEGAIGEIKVLRCTFAFVLNEQTYNIRLDDELGGGATWDVGCYGVNISRSIFEREPVAVYAEATSRPGAKVDSSVAAILDFGEGRRAVLDYAMDYGRRTFFEVMGTKGSISIESMLQEPDQPAFIYLRNDQGLQTRQIAPANHFQLEVEAFSQAILDGKPAPYSLEDSRANTRVCLTLLESIKQGKRLELHSR